MTHTKPVVIVSEPEGQDSSCCACCCSSKKVNALDRKRAIVLGYLQILLGVAAIALNIAGMCYGINWAYVAYGIWTGPVWVVTGCFCIAAGKNPVTCTVKTMLILSIISAATILHFYALSLTQLIMVYEGYYASNLNASLAISYLTLFVGLMELAVAIMAAVTCCRALGCCCCSNDTHVSPNTASCQGDLEAIKNIALPTGYVVIRVGDGNATGIVNASMIDVQATGPPAYQY